MCIRDSTTVPNQYNASELDVSSTTSAGNVLNDSLTSGDLGGLFAARTQAIDPALSQLGQVATALSSSVNAQQAAGLDLKGNAGAAIFSSPTPAAVASSKNTGTAAASVSISDVGALTSDEYILTYKGGAYSLANATDGTNVPVTGTSTDPLQANGISITLTGTPAPNDSFLIQPVSYTHLIRRAAQIKRATRWTSRSRDAAFCKSRNRTARSPIPATAPLPWTTRVTW